MKFTAKSFTHVSLLTVLLGTVLTSIALAAEPPSGDSNPSDLDNSTVSTGQIINPHPR